MSRPSLSSLSLPHPSRKPYDRLHPDRRRVLKAKDASRSPDITSSRLNASDESLGLHDSSSSPPYADPLFFSERPNSPAPTVARLFAESSEDLFPNDEFHSSQLSGEDEDRGGSLDSAPSDLDETADTSDPYMKEERGYEAEPVISHVSSGGQSLSDTDTDATMSDGDSRDWSRDIQEQVPRNETARRRSDTVSSQESVSMHSVSDSENDADDCLSMSDAAHEQHRDSPTPDPAQCLLSRTPTPSRADTSSARAVVLTIRICRSLPHTSLGSPNTSGTSGRLAPESLRTIVIPPGTHLDLSVKCGCSCSSWRTPSEVQAASRVVERTTSPVGDTETPGDASREGEAVDRADAPSRTLPRVVTSSSEADDSDDDDMDLVQSPASESSHLTVSAYTSDDIAPVVLDNEYRQVSPAVEAHPMDTAALSLRDRLPVLEPSEGECDVRDSGLPASMDDPTDGPASSPASAALSAAVDKRDCWGGKLAEITTAAETALVAMSAPDIDFGFPVSPESDSETFPSYLDFSHCLPAADTHVTATIRLPYEVAHDDNNVGEQQSPPSFDCTLFELSPQQSQEDPSQDVRDLDSLSPGPLQVESSGDPEALQISTGGYPAFPPARSAPSTDAYNHCSWCGMPDPKSFAPPAMEYVLNLHPDLPEEAESSPDASTSPIHSSDASAVPLDDASGPEVNTIRGDMHAEEQGSHTPESSLFQQSRQECREKILQKITHLVDLQGVIAARQAELSGLQHEVVHTQTEMKDIWEFMLCNELL